MLSESFNRCTVKQWMQRIRSVHMDKLVGKICFRRGLSSEVFMSPTRKHPYPEVRRVVAKELRKQGYSYSTIGRSMNRHHSSILYMTKDAYREERKKFNRDAQCRIREAQGQ